MHTRIETMILKRVATYGIDMPIKREEIKKLGAKLRYVGNIVGSYRRGLSNCNDLDMVAYNKTPDEVLSWLKKEFPFGLKIIRKGKKIMTFECKASILSPTIKVDIFFADSTNYSSMILWRTGSMAHNIKLCQIAKKRVMKLSENGLFFNDMLISNDETEILFTLLGKYVTPEERSL